MSTNPEKNSNKIPKSQRQNITANEYHTYPIEKHSLIAMRFLSAAYSNSAFSLLACRVALLLNLICFQVEAVKMRRKIIFTFSFSAFFLIWILLFIFGQMAYYYTKRLVFFSIRFVFRVHCFVFRLHFRYQAFAFF